MTAEEMLAHESRLLGECELVDSADLAGDITVIIYTYTAGKDTRWALACGDHVSHGGVVPSRAWMP